MLQLWTASMTLFNQLVVRVLTEVWLLTITTFLISAAWAMSEFRIHHDVNELLSLLHVRGGDGAEVFIDRLQKNRTPYITTTVSAHSAKVIDGEIIGTFCKGLCSFYQYPWLIQLSFSGQNSRVFQDARGLPKEIWWAQVKKCLQPGPTRLPPIKA